MTSATDKRLARDVQALTRKEGKVGQPLAAPATPATIPGGVGRAAGQAFSGELTSPLTEASRETVKYKVYDPNDSTQWIEVDQITKLVMTDANGREIVFNFVDPTA